MRNLMPVMVLFCFFIRDSKIYAQAPNYKIQEVYKGGTDSLKNDITKNLLKAVMEISRDYVLFFEVSIEETGFNGVTELYKQPDSISSEIYKAIEKTHSKWSPMKKSAKVIIPVLLVSDKEGSDMSNDFNYTTTSKDYSLNDTFIRCFFAPPLIINFFSQK